MEESRQIQIKLRTTEDQFAVPDATLSVPLNIGPERLNSLVKSLLTHLDSIPEFDFFLYDDLLRTSLVDFIQDRDDISSEHVLELLYLEQKAAPEPQDSVNHDDWVAGVDVCNGLILSACYDNTVSLWTTSGATRKLQIPGTYVYISKKDLLF
jgi:ribosome biogenesis protein YTM1